MAHPNFVGIGRLFNQHPETVGSVSCAALFSQFHERCGLSGVDQVVGEFASVKCERRNQRSFILQACRRGIHNQVIRLGTGLIIKDALNPKLVAEFLSTSNRTVSHGHRLGHAFHQGRENTANTTAGAEDKNLFVFYKELQTLFQITNETRAVCVFTENLVVLESKRIHGT